MALRNVVYLCKLIILCFAVYSANIRADIIYLHADLQGSIVAESNEAGKLNNSRHYSAYGEQLKSNKSGVGYTGHVYDNDLELTYMQARYYDPVIGRFYSNDPVGFTGNPHSFGRYTYVNNNPYKYTDPTGNIAESVWDAASLSYGITSLGSNLWNGNWGDAGIDALGVIADGAALAVPFVPGGASMAIGASRHADDAAQTLFHYTDDAGMDGILSSNKLNPSMKANNPNDARFGDGQYLSDTLPGTRTNAELSHDFIGIPFQGQKFKNYIEIDVTGLNAVKGRDGVFVIPNDAPLDLTGRIISSGSN